MHALLEHGASPSTTDNVGATALNWAIERGVYACLALCLSTPSIFTGVLLCARVLRYVSLFSPYLEAVIGGYYCHV